MDSYTAGLLTGCLLTLAAAWPVYVIYVWIEERRKWRRRGEFDNTLERLRRL